MNVVVKITSFLLLAAFAATGCSSTPVPQADPYNDADSQRSRAQQAQDELSSEADRE